jgi:3-oxoacyl-[acyl-carrier protein] reductase/meso-butanediol dehydrogenase/(S,S)-butanediol dehydrogenase/diacetyl reductase
MNRELDGKVAIVTGAGRMRGIGRKIAERLGAAGATVVVAGRRSGSSLPEEQEAGWRDIDSVAELIVQAGGRALPLAVDITQETSVAELFDRTLREFGRIDVLVNNAAYGRGSDRVPVVDLDFETWKSIYEVNTHGTFLTSRGAARALIEQGSGGSIINISTIATKSARAKVAAYASSKIAVNLLGRVMAMELARHQIRVNTVCPGFTDTSRLSDMSDAAFQNYIQTQIPLRRPDDGTQTAELVLFLASDRGQWITGQTIYADGGAVWGH